MKDETYWAILLALPIYLLNSFLLYIGSDLFFEEGIYHIIGIIFMIISVLLFIGITYEVRKKSKEAIKEKQVGGKE